MTTGVPMSGSSAMKKAYKNTIKRGGTNPRQKSWISSRFSDNFTTSFDVYRTEWDDFELEDSEGNKTSPISGLPSSESDVDPTYQVRLGAEYLFIQPKYVVPIRGGVFYDPAPAEGTPDDFYGFSVGSGIGIGRFVFDIAYQYRFGNDVGSSMMENLDFSEASCHGQFEEQHPNA